MVSRYNFVYIVYWINLILVHTIVHRMALHEANRSQLKQSSNNSEKKMYGGTEFRANTLSQHNY